MSVEKILSLIKEEKIAFIDMRFCDTHGREHHVTVPAAEADEDFFEEGHMFDGSSLAGWKGINESDMILLPDTESFYLDPFREHATLNIQCDVIEPQTMQGYERDPRSLAKRTEMYLRSTGIADTAYFGPEHEFFIFDSIHFHTSMGRVVLEIESNEAAWNDERPFAWGETGYGDHGYRPGVKGGYMPVAPMDSLQDLRAEMCLVLEEIGQKVEVHHHEVATGGQCEIGTRFNTLTRKADEVQAMKYVVRNVAHAAGKTVTFMPKPLVGDNGSGMHVHQSLTKDGKNLFSGDAYGGLSEMALYYIGGIIKHARALNAFTNPAVNSYKRLVPYFEAPVMLAYSARNRSASIRIPYITNPRARRLEVRFPDACANPYLAFSAMLMAGLDGIQNKIHPGEPMDKDLYDLPAEEAKNIPQVAFSLEQALQALEADHEFLTRGDVFSLDLIEAYIQIKNQEVSLLRTQVHPLEFEMYYTL